MRLGGATLWCAAQGGCINVFLEALVGAWSSRYKIGMGSCSASVKHGQTQCCLEGCVAGKLHGTLESSTCRDIRTSLLVVQNDKITQYFENSSLFSL